MSINDPLIIVYDEKHSWWKILQGRETFYDAETRVLLTWKTKEEAIEWAKINKPGKEIK